MLTLVNVALPKYIQVALLDDKDGGKYQKNEKKYQKFVFSSVFNIFLRYYVQDIRF